MFQRTPNYECSTPMSPTAPSSTQQYSRNYRGSALFRLVTSTESQKYAPKHALNLFIIVFLFSHSLSLFVCFFSFSFIEIQSIHRDTSSPITPLKSLESPLLYGYKSANNSESCSSNSSGNSPNNTSNTENLNLIDLIVSCAHLLSSRLFFFDRFWFRMIWYLVFKLVFAFF